MNECDLNEEEDIIYRPVEYAMNFGPVLITINVSNN